MKIKFSIFALSAILSITLFGCGKDDDKDNGPSSGTVTVDITNVAGNVNLDVSGASSYVNSAGELFTVSKFKYYVTNVRLLKDGVVKYTMPNSYFLVDEANQASTLLSLPSVPGGTYNGISFLIGVDSARNVSGAQTGALDPVNAMFWTWNSGYIFLKLEGSSPASGSGFTYHIGGFRESNNTNAIREVTLSFGASTMTVDGSREAEIHLLADVLKLFSTPTEISITSLSDVTMPGPDALMIADNYAQMFSFDHLHN